MIEINSTEALMVWLMHHLAEAAGTSAVLKGGMTLRLLDCPRHTNDLDYVFVGFKSKKDIVPIIEKVLTKLEGATWQISLHSTSVRILIQYKNHHTQIESNVANECKSQGLSTSSLAKPNNQLPRVINVMSLDWALANKLAAWNERGLMRDLYDVYFYHAVLDVMPDLKVLERRLSKITYLGKARLAQGAKKMTLEEFLAKISLAVTQIIPDGVETELRDYFPPEELPGLTHKIKIGVKSLVEKLREPL